MFRDKPTAYERLYASISDIGERIADLEEEVADRFNPRPSAGERVRRAVARNLPSIPGTHQHSASRYLPEFMTGWSLPSVSDARDSLHSLRKSLPDLRQEAEDARSHLPDLRHSVERTRSYLSGVGIPGMRRRVSRRHPLDALREHDTLTTVLIVGGAVVAVGAAFYVTKKIAEHTEEPDYETVRRDGDIEIRDYDAMVVAETVKSGYHERARRNGFETLANYIFANNRSGKKIAMTAPVLQQLSESEGRTKGWAIRFVMPKKYTKASLPTPSSNDVQLKEVPARRMAAIRFSGNFSATVASKKLMTLYNYLADENLTQKGDPEYAFYNPPWTPGFMKRNEILIEIER